MKEFYVKDYKINGLSDTLAINNAIIDCNKNGGGRVVIKSGEKYVAGLINLLSNVELHIEFLGFLFLTSNLDELAVIKQNTINKVNVPTYENCDYSGQPTQAFIKALNASNVSITGEGVIDGNEEIFYGIKNKWFIDGSYYPRVPLVFFENCQNVKIKDITFRRSGFWTTHIIGCKNVEIDSLKVFNNLKMANCDGIDVDASQNVIIKDCYIEAADDAIVFKNTQYGKRYGDCKEVEVLNCTLISTSAAIKFGTESWSDFKNIKISNINILRSNRGLSFQLRDKGSINNISFKNIYIETRRFSSPHYWGKAEPIAITAVDRTEGVSCGTISNISFENINADSENGIFIFAQREGQINNIKINGLNLEINQKTTWEHDTHDLRPSYKYGILNAKLNALYIYNASSVEIQSFKYEFDDKMSQYKEKDYYIENTKNIVIN